MTRSAAYTLTVDCPHCFGTVEHVHTLDMGDGLTHTTVRCLVCASDHLVMTRVRPVKTTQIGRDIEDRRDATKVVRDRSAPGAALIDAIEALHGSYGAIGACTPSRARRTAQEARSA